MKRIVLLAFLALVLPISAFANGSATVFTLNVGGTLSGGSGGLSLSGSELVAVLGLNGLSMVTGDLGTVSLTTGAMTSGNLVTGATFGDGTFVITSNGSSSLLPGAGVPIFSGTLTDIRWVAIPNASHTAFSYKLEADISGTLFNGTVVHGSITIGTFIPIKGGFSGSIIGNLVGTGVLTTVPEPGTLGLMGTGLLGLAGLVRRRLKA
jgi:hypothetical protein